MHDEVARALSQHLQLRKYIVAKPETMEPCKLVPTLLACLNFHAAKRVDPCPLDLSSRSASHGQTVIYSGGKIPPIPSAATIAIVEKMSFPLACF